MSWQALQFALDCDKVASEAERIVLVEYANHADERGYSWPSLKFIASRWHSHPARLRRARELVIGRGLLFRTKKRRGFTGQKKVFRMPKCTYERGRSELPFEKRQRGRKGGDKGAIRGPESPTNLDTDNPKPPSGDNTLGVITTTGKQTNAQISDWSSGNHQYQDTPARDHIKWPEFTAYCDSKHGTPTEEGFWTWLSRQKPQWRNKARPNFAGQEGYVLNGKFFTPEQANEHALKHPELLDRDSFRPATKHHGKIQIAK
jgi:hypothetical protein